jgi:hypothetical protein
MTPLRRSFWFLPGVAAPGRDAIEVIDLDEVLENQGFPESIKSPKSVITGLDEEEKQALVG